MRYSPFFLVCAAGIATLGLGQAMLPIAHAQGPVSSAPPDYQVRVQSLHTKHASQDLEITGQIVNIGHRPLICTSAFLVFSHAAGPVYPGQSAQLRAALPEPPAFTWISLTLREAGRPVTVQTGGSRLSHN